MNDDDEVEELEGFKWDRQNEGGACKRLVDLGKQQWDVHGRPIEAVVVAGAADVVDDAAAAVDAGDDAAAAADAVGDVVAVGFAAAAVVDAVGDVVAVDVVVAAAAAAAEYLANAPAAAVTLHWSNPSALHGLAYAPEGLGEAAEAVVDQISLNPFSSLLPLQKPLFPVVGGSPGPVSPDLALPYHVPSPSGNPPLPAVDEPTPLDGVDPYIVVLR
jgi:hypothetical protein